MLIIAVCFYFGIIFVNEKILLIGFALLVLLVVSIVELFYRYITISADLEAPMSIAEQGIPFHFGIGIKNKGILPVGRIRVGMYVKNVFDHRTNNSTLRVRKTLSGRHFKGLHSQKEKLEWISISAVDCKNEIFDSKMVLKQAGNHEICIKKMRIYAITGLLFVHKRCNVMTNVLVMPKIHAIGVKISEYTRHFSADADVYDETHAGNDVTELFEIRTYQPKDKLQNIHWKLSAKMDELMVKENALPKACSVVLFAEMKKDMQISAFLEVFVSISFSLMSAKCSHFVAWYSKEKEDITRMRVDDEESYYLFLNHYLMDVNLIQENDIRMEYQNKYKGEMYLHDIVVKGDLQIYCDGAYLTKLDAENVEESCRNLEFLL